MKPSTPFLSTLVKGSLNRSQLQRRRNAVEDVEPIINARGHQIFLYRNIRTNQIVYSFTRALDNNDALRQLPFLGKKTVPSVLRKDLWLPFALVEFPSHLKGLNAFRKLREFRRLHETNYPLDLITVKEGKHAGKLMKTKERGRALMDQKANSVADLAAVLLQDEHEQLARHEERMKLYRDKLNRPDTEAGTPPTEKIPDPPPAPGVDEVKIRWDNIMDAYHAEKWPRYVVHHTLERSRYTAAFPAYKMAEIEEGDAIRDAGDPPPPPPVEKETIQVGA